MHARGLRSWTAPCGLLVLLAVSSQLRAEPARPAVGYIAAESSLETLGPEARAGWELAGKLCPTTLLLAGPGGQFVDAQGQPVATDGLRVLWYHQGDAIARTSIYGGTALAAIRKHASDGGGVLLSGGALAMVAQLGLEGGVRPQRHELFNYRDPAGLIPLEQDHPAFAGLKLDGPIAWMSEAGPKAVADFAWGGPGGGMLLARTPKAVENPLVEYRLGKGRVIVLGWHVPHYGDPNNSHRENLQRLTANLLGYLGSPEAWRPVVVRSEYPPAADRGHPGISPRRWESLRLAVEDLAATFRERYPRGAEYLARLDALKKAHDALIPGQGQPAAEARPQLDKIVTDFQNLQREALLANPLMDFERLLLIRRGAGRLGLPLNYHSNSSLPTAGYDNQLAVLSPPRPDGKMTTLFKPEGGRFVGDVDLHFDADKMLFSMPAASGRWQVFEMQSDGSGLQQMKLIEQPDVDNYDACYLPDGRIVFSSTAPFVGVPCVGGTAHVTNLYLRDHDGSIRQLTVEQDHDWCPCVLNDGRVLYLRWEYTDTPHTFYRLLFSMNPDGTCQAEYYGSNSYWPNTMFYARPIPNHPTKVVAVVGGHHDSPRVGELVVFDPALGRQETQGVVQRIPGRGRKVKPVICDGLIGASWPRFLHPFPLSEKQFLVSCQPTRDALWGIYLVDVFDNFVLLAEQPGYAMLEPLPLRPVSRPPVVPDRVDLSKEHAEVFMADVYAGPGLAGVKRGTVKSMRLITYHFCYHGMGGEPDRVGLDGPWDVKRVIGTVPVEADGSARFRVPPLTPIALQPLDAKGKAVQLMRSWFTAMPGEVLSCVGCHEKQNTTPPPIRGTLAAVRPASQIKPWYGPVRGFSFKREVQPVLDRHCVGCHDGKPRADGRQIPDLTARPEVQVPRMSYNARFTPSYYVLRRLVRSPTTESDLHLLPPREFHADTSRLVQMLHKGHHGVKLDAESWDRLVTWIDLHTPAHGTWAETCRPEKAELVRHQRDRRRAMRIQYAGIDEDPEAILDLQGRAVETVLPDPPPAPAAAVSCPGWPFDAAEAVRRQQAAGPVTQSLELAQGVTLELARIPAGQFVIGSSEGFADEGPPARVEIERPFWIGRFEVTNRQYAAFDPRHDSRLEHGDFHQFGIYQRGYPLSRPEQPVLRVSWHEATAFCRWLSEKTGRRFALPTEAQWEWSCRAGTSGPLWYGDLDTDFSPFANVSDASHQRVDYPHVPTAVPPWRPADTRWDDKFRVAAPVGTYRANLWGLHDMHGNVAEWTRSAYRPYPYDEKDGRNDAADGGRRVTRGGSWYDLPRRCRSSFRQPYAADQVVYDVGFRVVCKEEGDGRATPAGD